MTYIVKDECIKCKHTTCVEVCPVDCFYEGENMLVINPNECIDCGVCEPECPVNAIVSDYDYNEKDKEIFFRSGFHRLAGNKTLEKQIKSGLSEREIRTTWQKGLKKFKELRNKYLIYN